MQSVDGESTKTQKAMQTAALWAAMTLPAASLFLSGCSSEHSQAERPDRPAATKTVDDDEGGGIGFGISGKPGFYDDSGIGINMDGELDFGIGF